MTDKISDNVGKKIVEALKMHNQPVKAEPVEIEDSISDDVEVQETVANEYPQEEDFAEETFQEVQSPKPSIDVSSILNDKSGHKDVDVIFQNTISQNLGSANFAENQSDYEYPNNVAILNRLIAKLPAGVSKQTGAIIIRQTIEALGIPMKSVIQEAQHVQEDLASRARNCQKDIIDFRKQIASLELKGQQYQKQAIAMNDIINLFMSTGI